MSRMYTVTTEAILVSAAQDLAQIKGAAGKMLYIRRVRVGNTDTTLATSQMLSLRARFLPATVTDGSGGSSPTPRPLDPGDSAASFTAKANDTTQATSSGTATVIDEWAVHIYSGLDDTFLKPPPVGPSESFTFELLSTVSGTVHLSTTLWIEEIGG